MPSHVESVFKLRRSEVRKDSFIVHRLCQFYVMCVEKERTASERLADGNDELNSTESSHFREDESSELLDLSQEDESKVN